jgi:C-terminal processing protease CtpA/Prc
MGLPMIKEVLPNGSAFSKLACGDVIISVSGRSVHKNSPLKTTMESIKGGQGTFVDITVLRFHPVQFNDEALTFRLMRQPLRILSPSIKHPAPLPTTFSSSPRSSYTGVSALFRHLGTLARHHPPATLLLKVCCR